MRLVRFMSLLLLTAACAPEPADDGGETGESDETENPETDETEVPETDDTEIPRACTWPFEGRGPAVAAWAVYDAPSGEVNVVESTGDGPRTLVAPQDGRVELPPGETPVVMLQADEACWSIWDVELADGVEAGDELRTGDVLALARDGQEALVAVRSGDCPVGETGLVPGPTRVPIVDFPAGWSSPSAWVEAGCEPPAPVCAATGEIALGAFVGTKTTIVGTAEGERLVRGEVRLDGVVLEEGVPPGAGQTTLSVGEPLDAATLADGPHTVALRVVDGVGCEAGAVVDTFTFTVPDDIPPWVDLAISDLVAVPSTTPYTGSVRLQFVVTHTGTLDLTTVLPGGFLPVNLVRKTRAGAVVAPGFGVDVAFPDPGTSVEVDLEVPSTDWIAWRSGTDALVTVTLDPADVVDEIDEANNAATVPVAVRDVELEAESAGYVPPASVRPGTATSASGVRLWNEGHVVAEDVKIVVGLPDPMVPTGVGRVLGTITRDLSPGGVTEVTVPFTVPTDLPPGPVTLGVWVDPDDVFAEHDETDNLATLSVTVLRKTYDAYIASGPDTNFAVVPQGGLVDVNTGVRHVSGDSGLELELWLSNDAVLDVGADLLLRTVAISTGTPPPRTYTVTATVTVPADVATGPWFVVVRVQTTDSAVWEDVDPTDDVASAPITVTCGSAAYWSPATVSGTGTSGGLTARLEVRDADDGGRTDFRVCAVSPATFPVDSWVDVLDGTTPLFGGVVATAGRACSEWTRLETTGFSEGETLDLRFRGVVPSTCTGSWSATCSLVGTTCGACARGAAGTLTRTCR